MLLAYILVRYGLNHLSALSVRNNPVYATWSNNIANFAPFCITLKCIYIRNPLSFNFFPKNRLIKGNLTFAALIPLMCSLSILLLSYK